MYTGRSREFYNYQMIWRIVEQNGYFLSTPDQGGKYGSKYSLVTCDPQQDKKYFVKQDHIISKGVHINNNDYIWDFVTPNNGYGNLKPEDYKSHLTGFPDHAILTVSINI